MQENKEAKKQISLSLVVGLLRARRRRLLPLLLAALAVTSYAHFRWSAYTVSVPLYFQTPSNDAVQATLSPSVPSIGGLGDKTNDQLEKYLLYMKTHEFFVELAKELQQNPEYSPIAQRLLSQRGRLTRFAKKLFLDLPKANSAEEDKNEQLAQLLQATIRAKKNGSDYLVIKASAVDPDLTVALANAVAHATISLSTRDDLADLEKAQKYLTEEMDRTRDRVKSLQVGLVDFKKRNNLLLLDSMRTDISSNLSQLQRELNDGRVKYQQNLKLIDLLSKQYTEQEQRLLSTGAKSLQSDAVAQLRRQIESLKYKRGLYQAQGIPEDSEEMSLLNEQIDQYATRLREKKGTDEGVASDVAPLSEGRGGLYSRISDLKKENQLLVARIESAKASIANLKQSYIYVPEGEQTVEGMRREQEVEFGLFAELKKRALAIQVQQINIRNRVRILETAAVMGVESRLGIAVKLALVSAFLLLSAAALLLWKEEVLPSVKFASDATKLRDELDRGFRYLGCVPLSSGKRGLVSWDFGDESPEKQAIDDLLASLLALSNQTSERPVSFALIDPTEGKTSRAVAAKSAYRLAQLLSKDMSKVLIVDCGTSGKFLSRLANVPKDLELGASGESDARRFIFPIDKRIDLIPGGRYIRSPAGVINRRRMSALLERSAALYNWIILVSPAAETHQEAALIASLASFPVLIGTSFLTTHRALLASLKALRFPAGKKVHLLLNDVDVRAPDFVPEVRQEYGKIAGLAVVDSRRAS